MSEFEYTTPEVISTTQIETYNSEIFEIVAQDNLSTPLGTFVISPLPSIYLPNLLPPEVINNINKNNSQVFEGKVTSYIPNIGIGTSIWSKGEYQFFQKMSKSYYRYIYDGSPNQWTERNLYTILKYLEYNKVKFNVEWQGSLVNRMSWLLHFE